MSGSETLSTNLHHKKAQEQKAQEAQENSYLSTQNSVIIKRRVHPRAEHPRSVRVHQRCSHLTFPEDE
jgi:hypothetical protein